MQFMRTTVSASKSILAFETAGGGSWPVWNRYISIDGKKAYEIGNICDTCAFYFERMEGATRNIRATTVIDALNRGLSHIEKAATGAIEEIMPDGPYVIILDTVLPVLCRPGEKGDYFSREQIETWGLDTFWGLPHNPRTEYYRLNTRKLSDDEMLFEFLVPMFPRTLLDDERVQEYRSRLRQRALPTAVSLSVLDIKEPCDTPTGASAEAVRSHWCLAHYLVDGHHKAYAAALEAKPITLLAFLATEQGVSSEQEIMRLAKELSSS